MRAHEEHIPHKETILVPDDGRNQRTLSGTQASRPPLFRQVGHPFQATRADARCSIRGHQHAITTSHPQAFTATPSQQRHTPSQQSPTSRLHSNAIKRQGDHSHIRQGTPILDKAENPILGKAATPILGKVATYATPVSMSCLTSRSINETGSMTHSGPMTFTLPGVRRPDGHRWKAYLCPSSLKTVCPAFSPEFTRATTFDGSDCGAGHKAVLRDPQEVIRAHQGVIRGSQWLIMAHQGSSGVQQRLLSLTEG